MVWQILALLIGNTALISFIQFMIVRHDNRKGQYAKILKQLDKTEKDSIRTQMLLLMSDYPEERAELFRLAEYYFTHLHGNWYMTTLFRKYLRDNGIDPPPWFAVAIQPEEKND